MFQFQVRRQDFRQSRLVETTAPDVPEGSVRLAIKLFALTANNVTYAAMGEGQLGYYDFFPAPEGWGHPPAWGFAVVESSRVEGITPGERFYGYFPLATHLDVMPVKLSPAGFYDGAAHRAVKSPIYNLYQRTTADPAYVAAREAEQALFRPLYATGWWAADYIQHGTPKPRSIVMSSASAKTALATAHQLKRLGADKLIALTSPRNRDYVAGTGLFQSVHTYDDVPSLSVEAPAVFVDFLGRDDLTNAVHSALGPALVRSVMIGATEARPGGIALPKQTPGGVTPEFFFVPSYASKRLKEGGPQLGAAMRDDMRAFYAASSAYVRPKQLTGAASIEPSWRHLVEGAVPPNEGLVIRM